MRNTIRRPRSAPLLLVLLLALAGCYTYQPVGGVVPAPGERIRLDLSDEGSARISRRIGYPIQRLEGRVIEAEPSSLLLGVSWGGIYAGTPFEDRRDTLSFRESDYFRLERRRLNVARTGAFGLGVVAVLAIVYQWLDIGESSTNGPVIPPPEV